MLTDNRNNMPILIANDHPVHTDNVLVSDINMHAYIYISLNVTSTLSDTASGALDGAFLIPLPLLFYHKHISRVSTSIFLSSIYLPCPPNSSLLSWLAAIVPTASSPLIVSPVSPLMK